MNVACINRLGWKAKVNLKQGLEMAYQNFLQKGNV
jgi:hypothetical protein